MTKQPLFECPNLDDLSISPGDLRDASQVLSLLAAYAAHKAGAMEARLAGNVEEALSLEWCCKDDYKRLPEWAKW